MKNNCCKRNNWLENNCCSQPWISSTLAGTLQSIVSIPQTQTTFNFIFILIQLTRSFQFARFQLICSSAPSSTAPRLTPAWTRSHPGSWQTNTFFFPSDSFSKGFDKICWSVPILLQAWSQPIQLGQRRRGGTMTSTMY